MTALARGGSKEDEACHRQCAEASARTLRGLAALGWARILSVNEDGSCIRFASKGTAANGTIAAEGLMRLLPGGPIALSISHAQTGLAISQTAGNIDDVPAAIALIDAAVQRWSERIADLARLSMHFVTAALPADGGCSPALVRLLVAPAIVLEASPVLDELPPAGLVLADYTSQEAVERGEPRRTPLSHDPRLAAPLQW